MTEASERMWQPIETAPRNGTQVLLWNPDNPYGEWPLMGEWSFPGWRIHFDGQRICPTHWHRAPGAAG